MGQQSLVEWHGKMLRAWQLAILRFSVTVDHADRLAVLAAANEMDRLGWQHGEGAEFGFFRRTSAKLCAAILQRSETADAILRQYLSCIEDARVKRAFAATLEIKQLQPIAVKRRPKPESDLWRGLHSRRSA